MEEWTMIDLPPLLEDAPVERSTSREKTNRWSRNELTASALAAKAALLARQPPRRFGMTISLDSYFTKPPYSDPPNEPVAWELTRPPKVWSASNQRKVRRKKR